MAYYLPDNPIDGLAESAQAGDVTSRHAMQRDPMSDLKVFWGPEICRLEYLLHLLDTGRIKDPHWTEDHAV
ncbi:MAG: hypothetical protein NVS2B16_00310 [Chloroflexota bacterium]